MSDYRFRRDLYNTLVPKWREVVAEMGRFGRHAWSGARPFEWNGYRASLLYERYKSAKHEYLFQDFWREHPDVLRYIVRYCVDLGNSGELKLIADPWTDDVRWADEPSSKAVVVARLYL